MAVAGELIAGDEAPAAVWDAPTQGAYTAVVTLIGGRASAIFEIVRRAADASPGTTELWTTLAGRADARRAAP